MVQFDLINFLEQSVSIPSHDDVSEIRDFLVSTLLHHGENPHVDFAGNIIATKGSGSPHIVLNTHMDTVPPYIPPTIDGDMLYGRGSCDAKGQIAVLFHAFLNTSPPGRLTLAITPDEERTSSGANALHFDHPPDAYIVGEPTGLDICNASKGRFEAKISVHGKSSHAAESHLHKNVINASTRIINALKNFDTHNSSSSHDFLGSPLLTPTLIKSGESSNQIPSLCEIIVDRRSVPPESAFSFQNSLENYLSDFTPSWAKISVTMSPRETPFLEPFFTPPNTKLIESFKKISKTRIRPFTAASEASYFAKLAPTVIFGPGDLTDSTGAVAHSDREYVRISDVVKSTNILSKIILEMNT
tara:strand:- start:145 stop:1218 length:1074 start_codon:yes stop_codon:yes gene_type:complete